MAIFGASLQLEKKKRKKNLLLVQLPMEGTPRAGEVSANEDKKDEKQKAEKEKEKAEQVSFGDPIVRGTRAKGNKNYAGHEPVSAADELRDLLYQAAQMEHLLLDIYLFAAASLRTDPQEFPDSPRRWHQAELTRSWKRTILGVCREEMQHLAQVNSLLTAAGGSPCFSKPNFPFKAGNWFSDISQEGNVTPLNLALLPFSREAIVRMIRYESTSLILRLQQQEKADAEWDPKLFNSALQAIYKAVGVFLRDDRARKQNATPEDTKSVEMTGTATTDRSRGALLAREELSHPFSLPQDTPDFGWQNKPYRTIKELYERIRQGFQDIPHVIVQGADKQIDVSKPGYDAGSPRPTISTTVRSAGEALRLIDVILAEGEGSELFTNEAALQAWLKDPTAMNPKELDRKSHLFRFMAILVEYDQEHEMDASFAPTRKVLTNPTSRWHSDQERPEKEGQWESPEHAQLVPDPEARKLLDAFNTTYHVMLEWLSQLFSQTGSKEERDAIGSFIFMAYMTQVLRPFMEILTCFPSGAADYCLAPSFETDQHSSVSGVQVTKLHAVARCIEQTKFDDPAIRDRAEALRKNVLHIIEEFEARTRYGYTTDGAPAATYLAMTPRQHYNEGADSFTLKGPALRIDFEGWAGVALATDPDPAEETRGVSGNTFAYCDEPNLNRGIYFQQTKDFPTREAIPFTDFNGPLIGVYATRFSVLQPIAARMHYSSDLSASQKAFATLVTVEPQQRYGWKFDLLPVQQLKRKVESLPHFEGQNHIVCPDGEPIDPMHLQLTTSTGAMILRRRCRQTECSVMDMAPSVRAGIGRHPYYLGAKPDDLAANISSMKHRLPDCCTTPFGYFRLRLAQLRLQLEATPPKELAHEKLRRRIEDVWRALDPAAVTLYDQLLLARRPLLERLEKETTTFEKLMLDGQPVENQEGKLKARHSEILKTVNAALNNIEDILIISQLQGAVEEWCAFDWVTLMKAASLTGQRNVSRALALLHTLSSTARKFIPTATKDIRSTRLKFRVKYRHTLSGQGAVAEEVLQKLPPELQKLEFDILPNNEDLEHEPKVGAMGSIPRWQLAYNFGFFDTDLNLTHVDGCLIVPIAMKMGE